MDPFVLNEKDGYFYGRGTSDDKAQAAVWIATPYPDETRRLQTEP